MTSRGTLILVVGPSGAGKDTLIRGARAALVEDPRIHFPRRVITRPSAAAGEEHEAVTPEAFIARRMRGAFALDWDAHGLHYGIPREIEKDLAAGRTVVVNVSRSIVPEARQRYRVRIVFVTASPHLLAERIGARGRESGAVAAARLARADAYTVNGPDVVTIVNDGAAEDAIARLVQAIRESAPDRAPTAHSLSGESGRGSG